MTTEALLPLGMFACGALAGLFSRWGPLSGWAALAFPLVLPPLGIGLTEWFCWGHPLTMLGPSMLCASPPFCTGYALHAYARAKAKSAALIGLLFAGVELLVLAAFLILGLIATQILQ